MNKFLSWFKSVFRAGHDPESIRPLADLYWGALVLCFVLVGLGAISIGVYKFMSVEKALSDSSVVGQLPQKVLPFKKEELTAVLDALIERQLQYEIYKRNAPAIADPSR